MAKDEKKPAEEVLNAAEVIEKTGSVTAGRIQCLTIIGQIEGHYLADNTAKTTKYEHIIPLLCSIEESEEIGGLMVLLNTVGGDVEAGLAIAELIASMKKPTVSVVLGGGHSIGVPLAVAAKRSFIVPSATMTLHPVRTSGLVLGVPQSFDALRRMQARISAFIVRHSRIDREKLASLIMRTDEIATDCGSIIDGSEAVSLGLIDEVGGLDAAMAALHDMISPRD
ncbi:MAG: ATP-dependent Clp protease proteolytic subunit [Clostridia bacterium]|nr:ATP-dependent Clp protease proteolytic subunit [Clostridia bacterium]